jgi:prephenate dehydrogenase
MPTQIALLGLNRVGASLGLALSPQADLRVTGFDPDPEAARAAQTRGMVHRSEWNALSAVEQADLVVLALPLSGQRDLLPALAPHLRPGCVVTSFGNLFGPPIAWAVEHLPAGRSFVASHPILTPTHLQSPQAGLDAARGDLFARALWALAPAPACTAEALQLVTRLAQTVGASPYYIDPVEHDGLMGGADAVPTLLAWALMRAAAASSGWDDMRKVADRSFSLVTAALGEAEVNRLTLNRESVLRHLDATLAELRALRDGIAQDQGALLDEALAEAAELRAAWLAQRERGEWGPPTDPDPDLPTPGEAVSQVLFGNLFSRRRGPRPKH